MLLTPQTCPGFGYVVAVRERKVSFLFGEGHYFEQMWFHGKTEWVA